MASLDPNVDLELIAAFIDGRLSGDERARVVKMLAESDEALEIFASATRAQSDAAAPKVVPITSARRWRGWRVAVPIAVAAALAFIMVPRIGGWRVQGDHSAEEPIVVLEQNPRFADGLGPGWEKRGWTVTRGGESARPEPARAFRLGVRSVDLQVALVRGDTALAGLLTSDVLEMLAGIRFSEMFAANFTELRSRMASDTREQAIERASRAVREMRDFLQSFSFTFGEWAGAAELAARTHDASFFKSDLTTRVIRSALKSGNLTAEDSEALMFIDARVRQGLGNRELDEVHEVLQNIIRRRGG